MNLAERLKRARESLGYTQKEMAKAVSVSVQMWQSYEAGRSVPGGNVLEALARLGFNVNWLLTDEGEIKRGAVDSVSQIQTLDEDLLNSIIISVIEHTNQNGDKDAVRELAESTALTIIKFYDMLSKSNKKQHYTPEKVSDYILLCSTLNKMSNGDAEVMDDLLREALKMRTVRKKQLIDPDG